MRSVVWLSLATVVASVTVRLIDHNVPSAYQGRVEVFYEGPDDNNRSVSGWFTVCDDYWDYREARVVCRQLGFVSYDQVYYGSYFGAGTARIAMDQLDCTGREESLHECKFDGWFRHDCRQREHAGVRCKVSDPASRVTLPVRLAQGERLSEGIVEILFQKRWGAVDRSHFGDENARVVCGQLGYPNGEARSCSDDVDDCGVYDGLVNARGFICSGREATLSKCKLVLWGPFDDDEDGTAHNVSDLAYVRCSVPLRTPHMPTRARPYGCNATVEKSSKNDADVVEPTLRLKAGIGPWEGRVEVYNTGSWSPLCDRNWDQYDGNVVCRQLGYGTAKKVHTSSRFGRGTGYNYNRFFECKGNESKLSECSHQDIGRYGCRHWQEAGVECYRPAKASEHVRLVNTKPVYLGVAGFVEVRHGSCDEWYRVCDEKWSLSQARAVCRDLELGFGKSGGLQLDSRKATTASITVSYRCTGDELLLADCDREVHKVVSGGHLCNETINSTASRADTEATLGENLANAFDEVSPCETGFAWVECARILPDLVVDVPVLKRTLGTYPHVVTTGGLPCAFEEGCFSKTAVAYEYGHDERVLLRFATRVMNLGRAPFQPYAPRNKWDWHQCHKHYHSFRAFSIYHVVDECGKPVAEGHKASFCLEDSDCEENGPPARSNFNCRGHYGGRQGISVNCADTYRHHIDCQWVDITDITPGRYRLVVDVNPYRHVAEIEFSNNVMYCDFRYNGKWSYITVYGCGFDPNWKSDV